MFEVGREIWSLLEGPYVLSEDYKVMKEVSTEAAQWASRAWTVAAWGEKLGRDTRLEQGGGCECGGHPRSGRGLKAEPGALSDKGVGGVRERETPKVSGPAPGGMERQTGSFWGR